MAFGDYATLIDDFNRASIGASWGQKVVTSNGDIGIGTNVCGGTTGGICSGWYIDSVPAADCEVYATVATPPSTGLTNVRVYARIATPSTAGVDAYFLQYTGNGSCSLFRLTNASATSIGSGSISLAPNDKIGIECIGSAISAYVYQSGAWTLLVTATDSTYSAAGYAGIGMNGGAGGAAVDDFYMGNIVPGPTPPAASVTIR